VNFNSPLPLVGLWSTVSPVYWWLSLSSGREGQCELSRKLSYITPEERIDFFDYDPLFRCSAGRGILDLIIWIVRIPGAPRTVMLSCSHNYVQSHPPSHIEHWPSKWFRPHCHSRSSLSLPPAMIPAFGAERKPSLWQAFSKLRLMNSIRPR